MKVVKTDDVDINIVDINNLLKNKKASERINLPDIKNLT